MGNPVNKSSGAIRAVARGHVLLTFTIVVALWAVQLTGCTRSDGDSNAMPAGSSVKLSEATNPQQGQPDCEYIVGVDGIAGVDGRDFNESTLDPSRARVYLFVAAKCPISNRYVPEMKRIRELCKARGHDFFVLYPDPEASVEALRKHADDYGLTEFALWDRRHVIADRWKANYTPEAVVVVAGKVVYRGRIDDWYVSFGKAKMAAETHDLRDVIESLDNGAELSLRETKVIGCPIPRLKQPDSSAANNESQAGAL